MILVRRDEESVTGRAVNNLRGTQAVWSAVSGHIPHDRSSTQRVQRAIACTRGVACCNNHCIQRPKPVPARPTAGKN